MDFLKKLATVNPAENEIVLAWLGQAGFLIKTHNEKIILIDPYLTDYVNRILQAENGQAFKRMTAPLFESGDIQADMLLCSHEHQDHLDIDALPGLLKNKTMKCYTNITSIGELKKNGIDTDRFTVLGKDETVETEEFTLTALDCDHGELAPAAQGLMLDFGFIKVYYSGDTGYNKSRLASAITSKPDLALLPINGAFGNLNAEEAAQFAADLEAKLCIPHHFWTFPAHAGPLGTPKDALEAFPKFAPGCTLYLATPGAVLIVRQNNGNISLETR
jgi:L-ascorbate 6-phosphate lactonase